MKMDTTTIKTTGLKGPKEKRAFITRRTQLGALKEGLKIPAYH
jgi:hypothetical protein